MGPTPERSEQTEAAAAAGGRPAGARPAGATPAAAILALQRSAGNAAVASAIAAGRIAARSPMPQLPGSQLGRGPGGPVLAGSELVPPGEYGGRFEGFETDVGASVFAQRRDRPCAVVDDGTSRFHVAPTDPPIGAEPDPDGASVRVVRFTGLQRVAGGSWVDRVDDAYDERGRWLRGGRDPARRERAVDAYMALLTEATGLTARDVHIAERAGDRPAGRITFDLEYAEAGVGGRGGDERAPRDDRDVPGWTLVFGPSAFENSPLLLARTLVHESTHVAHSQRRAELRREWLATGPRASWERFLEQRVRQGRLSPLERDLVDRPIRAGNADSEVMAHLAGFLAHFPDLEEEGPLVRMRASDDPLDELARQQDPAAGIVNAPLQDLDVMAENWAAAEPSIRGEAERRLRRLYDVGLSVVERRWFDWYVGSRFHDHRDEPESLWRTLWRFAFTPPPRTREARSGRRRRGRRD